jgi:hypothetical protein
LILGHIGHFPFQNALGKRKIPGITPSVVKEDMEWDFLRQIYDHTVDTVEEKNHIKRSSIFFSFLGGLYSYLSFSKDAKCCKSG